MLVFAIIDLRSSLDHPFGEAVDTLVRREDAERFIEEVRGDNRNVCELPADRGARARCVRAELPVANCADIRPSNA